MPPSADTLAERERVIALFAKAFLGNFDHTSKDGLRRVLDAIRNGTTAENFKVGAQAA